MTEEDWHDAALNVVYQFDAWTEARDPVISANRLIELNNAVTDLKSWLPGYEYETGTMPWGRGEDT